MSPARIHASTLATLLLLASCRGPTKTPAGSGDGGIDSGPILAPGQVLPGLPTTGATNGGSTVDYYIDVESPARFWIQSSGTFPGVAVHVYSDAARSNLVTTCQPLPYSADCFTDLSTGRYYLRIAPGFLSAGTYEFTLTPLTNEGSVATPVVVAQGDTRIHTTAPLGTSYYRFDAPVSGAYDLGLEALGTGFAFSHVTITLFADAGFSGTPIGVCDDTGSPTYCRFSGIASGQVYLRVDASQDAAGAFTLSPIHTYGEGAVVDAVTIGTTPHYGGIDDWSTSYYALTTTTAGSYVVSLDTTTLTSLTFSAHLGSPSNAPASSCAGLSCALHSLEPDTTYLVVATNAGQTAHFEILADHGLAVGAPLSPVPITSGATFSGRLDPGASSYYALTAPVSRYYTAQASGLASVPDTLTLRWSTDGGATTQTCTTRNDTVCDLGPIAAGTTIIYRVSGSQGVDPFSLTIAPQPFGEGVVSDPVALAVDTDHVGTQGDDHPNHYRFTSDASGGDYELIVSGDTQFVVSAPFACSGNGHTSICRVSGVAPNTTFDFTTGIYNATATHGITLRIAKTSVSRGCEPGNLVCYDFESGTTPADFTTPAQTFKTTTAAALRGTYGYENGKQSPACFSFVTPANARAISYSVELYSTASSLTDHLDISVDGTFVGGASPSASAGLPSRRTVALDTGVAHTVEFCRYTNASTEHAYLDDIAVR